LGYKCTVSHIVVTAPGRGRIGWLFFKARATSISEPIREERATPKNSQLAAAHRVAMKMDRRLSGRCRIGYISI
jgi:hypothetical protein